MKLSTIALKLRAAGTSFGNYIAGAAEMALAMEQTLTQETAFVIPLAETVTGNEQDSGYYQKITETFGIVCALKNDNAKYDNLGITAFDRLDDIRAEIFSAILNWLVPGTQYTIEYSGGRILDLNPAWLWYTYEFNMVRELDNDDVIAEADADDFLEIYSQWIIDPSLRTLDGVSLPTDIAAPALSKLISADHGFYDGFSSGFNTLAAYKNK